MAKKNIHVPYEMGLVLCEWAAEKSPDCGKEVGGVNLSMEKFRYSQCGRKADVSHIVCEDGFRMILSPVVKATMELEMYLVVGAPFVRVYMAGDDCLVIVVVKERSNGR